jgi:phosphonate transport system ATP-binding protein
MEILTKINREDRCTVIVSLHQVDIAIKYCPRVVALHEGRVVYDGPSSALTVSLLRDLYGVQAEEVLAPAEPAADGASPAPSRSEGALWGVPQARAA